MWVDEAINLGGPIWLYTSLSLFLNEWEKENLGPHFVVIWVKILNWQLSDEEWEFIEATRKLMNVF